MSPGNIMKEVIKKKLDIIGICDHNSAENVTALQKIGMNNDITVIGGMEVTTSEEVHVLALFESLDDLLELQEIIYESLPDDEHNVENQIIVNEKDEVVRFNKKLLVGASGLTVDDVVNLVHRKDGIAIASHVDRESFSITGQLGFIPDGILFDALEVMFPEQARKNPYYERFMFVTFSDAHYPWEIAQRFTTFLLKESSFVEIKKCLREMDRKRVLI
jgi:PHP family Zn ribbon phosphoesterase